MADYLTTDTELIAIADAIRAKGGTSESLEYPADFVSAINDISTAVNLKPYVLRPDAELIKTVSFDKLAVEDLELTLPAYSTSAQTLIASADLSPTIATDSLEDYSYYVLERFLAIPKYSVTSKAKGRVEYYASSYLYELTRQPGNTIHALIEPTRFITSQIAAFVASAFSRLVYYSGASTITSYSSNSTGLYMTPATPAYGSNAITLKSPTCGFKGSGTYFSSTYFNAMTDVRYQYVFDVYKAPNNNLNLDAWGSTQHFNHVIDCVNSQSQKLT